MVQSVYCPTVHETQNLKPSCGISAFGSNWKPSPVDEGARFASSSICRQRERNNKINTAVHHSPNRCLHVNERIELSSPLSMN